MTCSVIDLEYQCSDNHGPALTHGRARVPNVRFYRFNCLTRFSRFARIIIFVVAETRLGRRAILAPVML